MYIWESRGIGDLKLGNVFDVDVDKPNGYAIGKRWMEVTVRMWREDISKGLLFTWELYEDGRFPHWWLDEVLFGKKE